MRCDASDVERTIDASLLDPLEHKIDHQGTCQAKSEPSTELVHVSCDRLCLVPEAPSGKDEDTRPQSRARAIHGEELPWIDLIYPGHGRRYCAYTRNKLGEQKPASAVFGIGRVCPSNA